MRSRVFTTLGDSNRHPRLIHPVRRRFMRRVLLTIAGIMLIGMPASAQTGEEIVAKYVKTIGGPEKIQTVKTLRRSGRLSLGGGFEAAIVEENKRANMVRQEFSLQGLTAINAYDGKTGWKIAPFEGKKDPEPLGEEEMKQILEDSDFDGPLINYQQKGNKVEFVGMEPVEVNVKGSQNRRKVTYDKIEANVPIDDGRFHIPAPVAKSEPGAKPADASEKLPQKKEDE